MARSGKAKGKEKAAKGLRQAQEWTLLEKVLGALVAIMTVVAVYAFLATEEVVEVESIETYAGTVDLRAGATNTSRYTFTRELELDYQVRASYEVVEEGPLVHFKVWNSSTGHTLVPETTLGKYERNVRIDKEDAGVYEFIWWVEGDSGRTRVDIDVLIQPTEKIFEKKT
jgi:hypothetical protein